MEIVQAAIGEAVLVKVAAVVGDTPRINIWEEARNNQDGMIIIARGEVTEVSVEILELEEVALVLQADAVVAAAIGNKFQKDNKY